MELSLHDHPPGHEGVRLAVVGEISCRRKGLGESVAGREQRRGPLAPVGGAGVRVYIAVDPGDPIAGSHPEITRSESEFADHDDGGAGNVLSQWEAAYALDRGGSFVLGEATSECTGYKADRHPQRHETPQRSSRHSTHHDYAPHEGMRGAVKGEGAGAREG